MTVTINGNQYDLDTIAALMDDEIREALHGEGITDPQEFVEQYAAAHLAKYGEEWELSKPNPTW